MRSFDQFCHILPVPPRSFYAPLYVTNIGWENILPGQQYPVNKAAVYMFTWEEGRELPDFCLAYCEDGSGTLETRSGKVRLSAGESFLVQPGEWHRHRPTKSVGWTLYWIGFNGDLPHQWMRDESFELEESQPVIEDGKLFKAQFERILQTTHRAPTHNSEELAWQTIGLLSHFLRDRHQQAPANERGVKDIVSLAVEYIWNHTHAALSVSDIAEYVGCSRRTLEMHFKNSTHRTILEEIQACRADRARHLLESTDLPIKQIVYRSGFHTHEQMRLTLKRILGKSPSEIRNE